MEERKLSDAVNRSGFPLQIALQSLVERTRSHHECRVIFSEHFWLNPRDGRSGFIDLILEDGPEETVFVVECKRVVNCSWIFLIDDMKQMERRHAKAWVTEIREPPRFGFQEVQPAPMTPESQYCVVDGQDPKDRPMLERLASILVSSTEGFAREEHQEMARVGRDMRIYFSVIVTTAKLIVCEFDPQSIPLSTAEITNAAYKEVPFLRFRKQLGSHHEIPIITARDGARHGARHRAIAAAKESTVFIVNSECFSKFLQHFKVEALG